MVNKTADWFMVDIKQENLSEAMGFSRAAFGDSAAVFFDKFLMLRTCKFIYPVFLLLL